jgi:hypothetical protein
VVDHPKEASSRGRPPGLPQPDSPVDGDRTKRVPKTAGVGRTPKESAPNTKRLDRRQTIHQTPQNVWKTGRGPYAIPPAEASPGARLVPIDDPPDHRPRGLLPTSSSSTAVILSRVPRWGRFHCPRDCRAAPRCPEDPRRSPWSSVLIGPGDKSSPGPSRSLPSISTANRWFSPGGGNPGDRGIATIREPDHRHGLVAVCPRGVLVDIGAGCYPRGVLIRWERNLPKS